MRAVCRLFRVRSQALRRADLFHPSDEFDLGLVRDLFLKNKSEGTPCSTEMNVYLFACALASPVSAMFKN